MRSFVKGIGVSLLVTGFAAAAPAAAEEHRSTPAWPATAAEPVRFELPARAGGAAVGVAFRLDGAAAVPAHAEVDARRFVGALPDGDVLLRAAGTGVEDFVRFARRPAEERLRYRIDVRGVAGLRLVGGALEFLDDDRALRAGAGALFVGYRAGDAVTLGGRVGGGLLVGSLETERSGAFRTDAAGYPFEVGPLVEHHGATYGFVGGEARLGFRAARDLELAVGVAARGYFGASVPTWADETPPLAGDCLGGGPCEGEAEFGADDLLGDALFVVVPGLTLSYSLGL